MAIIQLRKTPAPIRAAVPPTVAPASTAAPATRSQAAVTRVVDPNATQAGATLSGQGASTPQNVAAGVGTSSDVLSIIANVVGLPGAAASSIQALGPQSGLQVVPVIFQSVDQEGKWKPHGQKKGATDFSDRNFSVNVAPAVPASYTIGNKSYPESLFKASYYAQLQKCRAGLFTITTGNSRSSVSIDAMWWADGLEIYAGFAGMGGSTGFGSVFSDNAAISLQAIPFGNYFPGSVFVTWSGWVNPIGGNVNGTYREFRGGLVLYPDGSCSNPNIAKSLNGGDPAPAYMQVWGRTTTDDAQWGPQGFTLRVG
jgi:hypothetical protein